MAGRTRHDRIIDAMLALAAERPWRELTLAAIADSARVDLTDLRREFSSRSAILAGFLDRIDAEMLAVDEPLDPGEPVRDRIFDLMMRRFDALGPHKAAIRNIVAGAAREPGAVLGAAARLLNVQTWILEAAGGSARGLMGRLRVKGLAAVYAGTFRVWLEEDDKGLPRTMATLDRALRRGERWAARAEPPVAMAEALCGVAASILGPSGRREGAAEAEGTGAPAAKP